MIYLENNCKAAQDLLFFYKKNGVFNIRRALTNRIGAVKYKKIPSYWCTELLQWKLGLLSLKLCFNHLVQRLDRRNHFQPKVTVKKYHGERQTTCLISSTYLMVQLGILYCLAPLSLEFSWALQMFQTSILSFPYFLAWWYSVLKRGITFAVLGASLSTHDVVLIALIFYKLPVKTHTVLYMNLN